MPLFPVRAIEWEIEDGQEITIVKVTGTVDGVGFGDVIDYRNENTFMNPQTSDVRQVLSMLDDLAWQLGDNAVFARCRNRLQELVKAEKKMKCERCNGTGRMLIAVADTRIKCDQCQA